MAVQAIVTIRDKQWQCTVANTPQELASGLSGVESISPDTGMLFDMGWDYPVIDIYTDEMLFPMDIIFINSVYGVVEVLRNVHPGDEVLFQEEPGAQYFLEINAGEAEGIEVGDGVLIQPGEEMPEAPSWITGLAGLAGFMTMGLFMVGITRNLTSKALEEAEEKPALLPQASSRRPTRHDVTVEAWQERDRLGIWITDSLTGKTIAEWWDEDAREMFEQGFFKPGVPQRTTEKPSRDFVDSVLDYAESVELLAGGKYLAQTMKDAYYWTAINKDTGEIAESYVPYTSSGRALRGGKAFVSRHWQGLALIEVWKQPHRYSENLKIEPVTSERLTRQKAPAAIATEEKPAGNCYADAWRFVIKEGEGELVHGTVYSGNRRIAHAWVETSTGWIWEPQTRRYFTSLGFRHDYAPVEESRYTAEEAAIMAARTKHLGPWTGQERRRYLEGKSPAVIPEHKQQPRLKGEIEFLPDSPEFLAYTIDDIGYRDKIDSAFLSAIARARGGR
jgi:uncharacterized membrane protein (UPF0127 family)